MRTLDAGLAAHLASGATTLATCWRIVRADGAVLGFTDHDCVLEFDGTVFEPEAGLDRGEATSRTGPQVETSEVLGVLRSDRIAEDDIRLGRYDGAAVETWRVNWRDVGQRVLLRADTIGEIVCEDSVFRAELRSPQHRLNRADGRLYQPLCDAVLGDGRCGVALDDPSLRTAVAVVAVLDRNRVAVTGLGGFAVGWFDFGRALWSGGVRVGVTDRIVSHRRIGGEDVLTFEQPVGTWVAPGDTAVATAGCDRQYSTCRSKFANTTNFRGFPHVPGNDFLLRYPQPGERRAGQALVR